MTRQRIPATGRPGRRPDRRGKRLISRTRNRHADRSTETVGRTRQGERRHAVAPLDPARSLRRDASGPLTLSAMGSRRANLSIRAPTGRATARRRPVEGHAAVAQRHVRVVADDEVVEQVDVEQAAGRERLGREVQVVRGRRRVARRVVVDEDHARRVEPDGVPEQLADPDERRRHVALVDGRDAQDDVLRVRGSRPAAPRARAGPSGGRAGRRRRAASGWSSGRPASRRAVAGRARTRPTSCAALAAPMPGHGLQLDVRRPGEAGQAVVARRGRRSRRRPPTGPRPRSPARARSAPRPVSPARPAQGEALAGRSAAGSSRMASPARRSRALVSTRHGLLRGGGRGVPAARTTRARRFLPPSGPRGRRGACRFPPPSDRTPSWRWLTCRLTGAGRRRSATVARAPQGTRDAARRGLGEHDQDRR